MTEKLTEEEWQAEFKAALAKHAAEKAKTEARPNGNGADRPRKRKKASSAVVVATPPDEAEPDLADDADGFTDIPPSHDEILEMLAGMDDVEYERCREHKMREWGLRAPAMDMMRRAAKRLQAYRHKEKPPEPDPNEDRLQRILNTEGIPDLWLKSWDKVMAGEHRNAKLLYLVATSRLFDDCMHAAIKGPSSAGKSKIRKQVLDFFPREDVVSFTTLSEKALLYYEDDFCNKILSMGEASGAEEQSLQDYLLRELMSEGRINYPVAMKVHGHIVTQNIVKHGPVAFMVTTTKAALHPENETRMLSLEVDDSEKQTKRVLAMQAKTVGRNIKPDDGVYLDWQDFQRVLRKFFRNVDVPFAGALAALIPPRATRLRRDYPQIIACIKAHALIHLYRRGTNEKGEIIADLDLDYVPVADLIGHIAAEGAGIAASKELIETLDAVKIETADPNVPADDGATAYQIGRRLRLDKSAARRRLLVAMDKGFIVNLEQRKFQPGKYRLTEQEIETETLLPSAEEIRAFASGGSK